MLTVEDEPAVAVEETMAKKKPEPEPSRTLFAVKGDPAWHEWLKSYADSLGMTVTGVIDYALREQAKRDKFAEPMPKRFGR